MPVADHPIISHLTAVIPVSPLPWCLSAAGQGGGGLPSVEVQAAAAADTAASAPAGAPAGDAAADGSCAAGDGPSRPCSRRMPSQPATSGSFPPDGCQHALPACQARSACAARPNPSSSPAALRQVRLHADQAPGHRGPRWHRWQPDERPATVASSASCGAAACRAPGLGAGQLC